MRNLYVALSTAQYASLKKNKALPPTVEENGCPAILFSEDKTHWIDKLRAQKDLDDVNGYDYAFIIEFRMDPRVLNDLIENPETGRLSEKIYNYYAELGKQTDIPQLQPDDTNVLCVMDVYESEETDDTVSQLWMLKVESTSHDLWEYFRSETPVINCIGAIPGAKEAADALAESMG
jgi:hypothetical protein